MPLLHTPMRKSEGKRRQGKYERSYKVRLSVYLVVLQQELAWWGRLRGRGVSTELPLLGFSLGLEIFGFPAQGFGLGLAVGFFVADGEVFYGLDSQGICGREVLTFEPE